MTTEANSPEFKRIVTLFTALAMLFVSKVIDETEFVFYLRREICDVQKEQRTESI